jgi:hypothetical protein
VPPPDGVRGDAERLARRSGTRSSSTTVVLHLLATGPDDAGVDAGGRVISACQIS